MRSLFCLGLVGALALAGCRKPMASADYLAASNRYTNLLALHGDSAYARPEMTEVTDRLAKVDPKSLDFQKAQELLVKINAEKQRVMAEEAKNLIAANPIAPPPNFPDLPAVQAPGAVEAGGGGGGGRDAGPGSDVAVGADFNGLNNRYPGCLIAREPVTMIGRDGGPMPLDGYGIHDSESCKTRMPAMLGNVMLVRDGKVAYLMPAASLKIVTTLEDGGAVP